MSSNPAEKNRNRDGEKGAVAALAAIMLFVMILMLGLAVDISHFYMVKTELQNAVDSAAIAAASELNSTPEGITLAQARAVAEINRYELNHRDVDLTADDVYFATNFSDVQGFLYPGDGTTTCATIRGSSLPATVKREADAEAIASQIRFVAICMPAPAATNVFFASNILADPLIKAKAIAGNSPPLTGICDVLAPMALVDDPDIPNGTEFVGTHVYRLRGEPGPPGSVEPGNYQLLETCGPGGANVRDALKGNCEGCKSINDTVPPKTGVTAGPVRQGWNDRFDSDLIKTEGITYAAYQQNYADYINNPGTTPDYINTSGRYGRRIIISPIIERTEFCNGHSCPEMKIVGFASFFLQSKVPGGNGGEITAEFIAELPIANGTFDPDKDPIPSLTKIVLYR